MKTFIHTNNQNFRFRNHMWWVFLMLSANFLFTKSHFSQQRPWQCKNKMFFFLFHLTWFPQRHKSPTFTANFFWTSLMFPKRHFQPINKISRFEISQSPTGILLKNKSRVICNFEIRKFNYFLYSPWFVWCFRLLQFAVRIYWRSRILKSS